MSVHFSKGLSDEHPGVLDAKVGYFDPKSAKVLPEQIGTKPAKIGHLAANLLKYVPKIHVSPKYMYFGDVL